MRVPFLDLSRIHAPLADEFAASFRVLVERSAFVNGPEVSAFEEAFARYLGARYCIGLASGLDALVIGLRCLGLRPGDRVVVPAMTFAATTEAVTQAGGTPVLVDVDEHGLMDLAAAEIEVARGARLVMPVHLYGDMVDPDGLDRLTAAGALVLEDACQAHGARAGGRMAGTIGRAAAFSFYPGKNLGALGDAGALVTDDAGVDRLSRALREHGQTKKYFHEHEGYTARLDNIQAAFLSTKLRHLDVWNAQRIAIAARYAGNLKDLRAGRLQHVRLDGGHVYHLLVLVTDRREALVDELKRLGTGFGLHYPLAIHQLPCYRDAAWRAGCFSRAELFAARAISLPIFPGMTEAETDGVIDAVRRVCG